MYRGDTREYTAQVLDQNADPFDLGPTNNPKWTFVAECRNDTRVNGGSVLFSFTVVVEDGPTGLIRIKVDPDDTGTISDDTGYWDVQIVNESDTNFDTGFTQTIWRGAVAFIGDVAE